MSKNELGETHISQPMHVVCLSVPLFSLDYSKWHAGISLVMHLSMLSPRGGGPRAYVGHLTSIAFPTLGNLTKNLGPRFEYFEYSFCDHMTWLSTRLSPEQLPSWKAPQNKTLWRGWFWESNRALYEVTANETQCTELDSYIFVCNGRIEWKICSIDPMQKWLTF